MSQRRTDRSHVYRPPVAVAAAAVAVVAVTVGGCGTEVAGIRPMERSTAARSTPVATDARVDGSQCADAPPRGALTRAPGGLVFSRGEIRVRVQQLGVPLVPDKKVDGAEPGDAAAGDGCFAYPRWGNRDVVVPLESALFVFSDARGHGATVEVSLADLVSRAQMTGQVTAVADDSTFMANSCAVTMTAVSEARAAGRFTCASAVSVTENPFAPSDDIDPTDRTPETSTPAPTAPAPPPPAASPTPTETPQRPSASLAGWFVLDR